MRGWDLDDHWRGTLRRAQAHASAPCLPRAALALAAMVALLADPGWAQSFSLRFYGHGTGMIDRIKIPIDAPARPADVGGNFTLEWWMKANLADNGSGSCTGGGDAWINGNIIFDRDVYGSGDFGDFGISLYGGLIAFGVDRLGAGNTVCSENHVADGVWHHIAVTRNSASGALRIFIDGQQQPEDFGPLGDISYNDGRPTSYPTSDPFLVIGAEKHDANPAQYPSYNGLLDEVRLSNVIRYPADFTPPAAPFTTDASTVALYHFEEGPAGPCSGTVNDNSGASGGASNGTCAYGGSSPSGPVYVGDTPFGAAPTPTPLCGATPVASGCRTPGGSQLLLKDKSAPAGDKLIWKWIKGAESTTGDFADPVGGATTYSVCVYDDTLAVPALAMSATLAGGSGWTASGGAFKYLDPTGAVGGIVKVLLKPGGEGKAKILVKGKGGALPLPGPVSATEYFNHTPTLTVQLLHSGGQCWEAVYGGTPVRNEAETFKAKVP